MTRRVAPEHAASLCRALLARRTLARYALDWTVLHDLPDEPETRHLMLAAVMRELLESLDQRLQREPVPESIATLTREQAERIARTLDAQRLLTLDDDGCLKDLAILLLNLLPCGAELVQVRAGIPRALLLRADMRQLLRGTWFFTARTGGFRPFLSLHMDVRSTAQFTPEGWHYTYLRIAELLQARPALKGVFGTAWFYDPAVAEISPHLAYLRTQREAAGAQNFRYGPSDSARCNALARSATRRRLYEQGTYQPESYYLVWPRRDLLAWARATHGNDHRKDRAPR